MELKAFKSFWNYVNSTSNWSTNYLDTNNTSSVTDKNDTVSISQSNIYLINNNTNHNAIDAKNKPKISKKNSKMKRQNSKTSILLSKTSKFKLTE